MAINLTRENFVKEVEESNEDEYDYDRDGEGQGYVIIKGVGRENKKKVYNALDKYMYN